MNRMCTATCGDGIVNFFSRKLVEEIPLSINLAKLKEQGYPTLQRYIDYTLDYPDHPTSFTLPVTDSSRFLKELIITSVDGERLAGFWKNQCCSRHCERETKPHPCINDTESDEEEEGANWTRDLTRELSCQTNHQDEITSCEILAITLHHQHRGDTRITVSVELSIGCQKKEQGVFVIQHHAGLTFSLERERIKASV